MDNLKIAVIGSVDHGKSTLIGRLLYETGSLTEDTIDMVRQRSQALGRREEFAFVTDNLSEEQTGGLTIDTTTVELKTATGNYVLVDTPGHREFLKNMATGGTTADAAILVIDASEGLCAQTYRHLRLTAMFGVKEIMVIINKMDLISYDSNGFARLAAEVRDLINTLGKKITSVVPVSTRFGDNITASSHNMPWCTTPTLLDSLALFSCRTDLTELPLRLNVQCTYRLPGKIAVLGKIVSGTVFKGRKVFFAPSGPATKVTSIIISDRDCCCAFAGQSVAIFVEEPTNISRGQVVCEIDNPVTIAETLCGRVFWISSQPVCIGQKVNILCGAQNCGATLAKITDSFDPACPHTYFAEPDRLEDCQIADVAFKLDQPLCFDKFQQPAELARFAVAAGGTIAGGGIIR